MNEIPGNMTDDKHRNNVEDDSCEVHLTMTTSSSSAVVLESISKYLVFFIFIDSNLFFVFMIFLKMRMLRVMRMKIGPSSVVIRG